MTDWQAVIGGLDPARPVVIAGATASGKSELALRIAERQGGVIVNADALQVWSCWRVLSARPGPDDLARAPHRLYGHLPCGADYSVGHWLREVEGVLASGERAIVVGGTGLYLSALTGGLAEVPPVPPEVRTEADARLAARGIAAMLAEVDAATAARLDPMNPARVQRAWEVLRATGRGLADWQNAQTAPLLPPGRVQALAIDAGREWLNARIDRRFDAMIAGGALDEVRAILPIWQPSALWARAIGAPELVAHLMGTLGLGDATSAAKLASRRYAKRQRTWLRSRMGGWRRISPA